MTYFNFLAIFVGIPILLLLGATAVDHQRGRTQPRSFTAVSPWLALLAHIVIAFVYTTPWDNYLVATRVWWYDPALVSGIVFGWVPIEEYTFFIVQPIMTGLWLLFWMRRTQDAPPRRGEQAVRTGALWLLGLLWVLFTAVLISRWQPGTYLALELVWAIPPIMLQVWFGGHILWRNRRLVLLGLLPTTLYLAAADALAINFGTWTINPAQSMNILIGGTLPVEEFIFFLLTNTLITFGMTLALAESSKERMRQLRMMLLSRKPVQSK